MLMDAIKRGASDLHFEPHETKYRSAFGSTASCTKSPPPVNLANRFSARLKVMARLDIAERRLPQDGRIKLKCRATSRWMDMRVNTLPTMWGEKIVIRLLDSSAPAQYRSTGFRRPPEGAIPACLSKPQG